MVSHRFAFATECSDMVEFNVVRNIECAKGCGVCFMVVIRAGTGYNGDWMNHDEGRYMHNTLWEAFNLISHRSEAYANIIEREYRKQVQVDNQTVLFTE